MASQKWFEKNLRRILVDMHIPDWDGRLLRDFSPARYAEMMKLANITVAEIYAGSCLGLCYWPTKVGFPHKQLKGRDILGATIKACKKAGIAVQLYLNVWCRAGYDAHPEWRMILEDGAGNREHQNTRFGLCCFNRGFGKMFLQELDELNSRYDGVGLWIDMIGWFSKVCYCPECTARFRKESVYNEIPRFIDWNDPCWLAYESCRERWLTEFGRKIVATVKKRTPDRTVTLQSASIVVGWGGAMNLDFLSSSDFLAGDFTGDSIEQSAVCKMFGAFSKNRPMEFMTPRCETLLHHTTERSYINLLMRAYAALANQASFTLIDAIDPFGTLDRRFYEHAHSINAAYRKYEKYIDGSSVPLADAAIYFNTDSQVDIDSPRPVEKRSEADSKHWMPRRNIVKTLSGKHLLFTFATNRTKDLGKYPLLIVSDASRLADEECEALAEYVRNGGKVFASYHTSLYDPEKGFRGDFKLAEMFGIHYRGKTLPLTYISPTEKSMFNDFFTRAHPVMLDGPQIILDAEPDAEVLGTLALPCSGREEVVRFGSAISNPPMIWEKSPAAIRHKFGKGEAIYVAGKLEDMGFDAHREILAGIFLSLLGKKKIIETNAPATTEITVFDQPDKRRLIISVLNLPADLPPAPLFDIKVRVNLPTGIRAKRLLLAPEESPVPCRTAKNSIAFRLERLDQYSMLILQYTGSAK